MFNGLDVACVLTKKHWQVLMQRAIVDQSAAFVINAIVVPTPGMELADTR